MSIINIKKVKLKYHWNFPLIFSIYVENFPYYCPKLLLTFYLK